jgi:DNA-binding response OmpR family regulator
MARIIVVEDDFAQQEELVSFLVLAGYQASGVVSGEELDLGLQSFTPEIILLDYNLPDTCGVSLTERLRTQFGQAMGIIMVTARGGVADRIECRRAGADDYLVKPIDFQEMLITIDNLLMRIKPFVRIDEVWTVHRARAELWSPGGAVIPLGAFEVAVLSSLAEQAHHRACRDTLMCALGKNPQAYDPRALETVISRLRRKLPDMACGRNPLQAVRGSGYQFLRTLVVK